MMLARDNALSHAVRNTLVMIVANNENSFTCANVTCVLTRYALKK